jgi:hypothetical protein
MLPALGRTGALHGTKKEGNKVLLNGLSPCGYFSSFYYHERRCVPEKGGCAKGFALSSSV